MESGDGDGGGSTGVLVHLGLMTQRERVGAPAAIVPRVPLPRALLYAGRRVEGSVSWTGRVYRDRLSVMGTEVKVQEYRWVEARGKCNPTTQRERVRTPAAMASSVPCILMLRRASGGRVQVGQERYTKSG